MTIPFSQLQRIVAYVNRHEPPKIFYHEKPSNGESWSFAHVSDFKRLTGFPFKKQEVFDVERDEFIPIDEFVPKPLPLYSFFITRPANFQKRACLDLDEHLGLLRRIHAGNLPTAYTKERAERLINPRDYRLGQRGRTKVIRRGQRSRTGKKEEVATQASKILSAMVRWLELMYLNQETNASGSKTTGEGTLSTTAM
ncbi:hypothetical protein NP233_g9204 [Leucocoprinus birnbaumii]|uniref:Uncharacterized protein n=1 Tax=Leucocoprinus birnbaumii TaxID=56174 RepID=A0AAD5YT45_9AGAR|nr:hypothetical protein NP233_g9204 [Leucocoprinus birnbaumii]